MATRETTGRTARWTKRLDAKATRGLAVAAEGAVFFLLGAVLASAEVFGQYAPFGLALVGAAGAGIPGFCSLAGASMGYLCLQGLASGLRYGAAAILIFSVAFATYDLPLGRKVWFMPTVTALLCGVTAVLSLNAQSWSITVPVFLLTEMIFAGGASYFYKMVVGTSREKHTPGHNIGLLLMVGAILISLDGVPLFWDLSLGRIAAAVLVLLAARQGISTGTLAGVAAGVAMDLASGDSPYYSMIYALAGLLSGTVRTRGKPVTVGVYLLTTGVAVLWTWNSGMRVNLIYEVCAAAAVFLLLPERVKRMAGEMIAIPSKSHTTDWEKSRQRVTRRMKDTATAFRTVYDSLRDTMHPEKDNGEDAAVMFERTAERVCRSCALRDICWQQECATTYNALNDATAAVLERGRAIPTDFSAQFSGRCLHFPEFITHLNEEVTALLCRRQYQSRMHESRAALCLQYAQVDQILGRAATELSEDVTPDLPREKQLRAYLRARGLEEDGTVYYDANGHLCVETPDAEALKTEEGRHRLSRAMGISLREAQVLGRRLIFTQAEPLLATASVSAACKEGESVSGDTGMWFRREDGTLFLLLCDGMGSGAAARKESALAVHLLQGFLKAGMEANAALATVNTALALRGEETGGCTTIDLLSVELFTGLSHVYKLGAAPTYVRKQGTVRCMVGSALPAGVLTGTAVQPDVNQFRAGEGDWIVLASDGVTGGESDEWLRQTLRDYMGSSPGELADLILSKSPNKGLDDATVLAVRMESRNPVSNKVQESE